MADARKQGALAKEQGKEAAKESVEMEAGDVDLSSPSSALSEGVTKALDSVQRVVEGVNDMVISEADNTFGAVGKRLSSNVAEPISTAKDTVSTAAAVTEDVVTAVVDEATTPVGGEATLAEVPPPPTPTAAFQDPEIDAVSHRATAGSQDGEALPTWINVTESATDKTNTLGLVITDQCRADARKIEAACAKEGIKIQSHWTLYKMVSVVKGDVEKAVRRFKAMRECMDRFKVDEVDSMRAYDVVQRSLPGSYAGFIGRDLQGRHTCFVNAAKFYPSIMLSDPYVEQCFMRVMVDCMDAVATKVEDVERGISFVQFAKGVGYKNFSMQMEKDFAWMYQDGFPVHIKLIAMVDGNIFLRSIIKLCRVFLSKKMQERIKIVSSSTLHELLTPEVLARGTGCGDEKFGEQRQYYMEHLRQAKALEDSFSF